MRNLTTGFVLALGLIGLWVAADGALQGSVIHRVAGVVIGLVIGLPGFLQLCMGRRGGWWARRSLLSGLAALIALLAAELACRSLDIGLYGPPLMVDHPVLGVAGTPETGDLDARGFRNRRAMAQADVVVLGDSNTFGFKVLRDEAFPQVLAQLSGWSVYNMAHGGWGPLQYLALAEDALAMRPATVVVALFIGNDIMDAHRYLGLEHWADLRDPVVPVPEPRGFVEHPRAAPNLAMSLVDMLRDNSRVMGWAIHAVAGRMRENEMLGALAFQERGAPRFSGGTVATLFMPAYRKPLLDAGRRAVRDGLRVSAICLRRIAGACRSANVIPVLMILPTKEYVYHRWLSPSGHLVAQRLAELAVRENECGNQIRAVATAAGMVVLDPTDTLVKALVEDRAPYWTTADEHLARQGCAEIAAFLARELRTLVPR